MKRVAIILSGCGVYDGSEIHEAVLTLLALDRAGAEYQCFAPDIPQLHVINHLTGEVMEGQQRNVRIEAARIARGDIRDLGELDSREFDALILPGGFGAAKNLSNFATEGAGCTVQVDVLAACRAFAEAAKPAAYLCISPALLPNIYGPGVLGTIGTDADTAALFDAMGGHHINCPVDDFVVDDARKVISTPAYMLAERISDAAAGIDKTVARLLAMC